MIRKITKITNTTASPPIHATIPITHHAPHTTNPRHGIADRQRAKPSMAKNPAITSGIVRHGTIINIRQINASRMQSPMMLVAMKRTTKTRTMRRRLVIIITISIMTIMRSKISPHRAPIVRSMTPTPAKTMAIIKAITPLTAAKMKGNAPAINASNIPSIRRRKNM